MQNKTQKPFREHYAYEQTTMADTGHIKNKICDIPYAGLSPSQKLDIYFPDQGGGPYPVIVWIHGGAFMCGDKGDFQVSPILKSLKRGYALISINYRLSWEAKFPALIHDARVAIRWIKANAAQYNLTGDRIAVWGASAGGYIAYFIGISPDVPGLEDLGLGDADQSSDVQAVVVWFGPTNFLLMDQHLAESGLAPDPFKAHSGSDSPESLLLGGKITDIKEKVEEASPEKYITQDTPAFLIQHGTKDSTVPVQQSISIAASLEKVSGMGIVTLELLQGAEHADPAFETLENINRVLDFIDSHLKQV